jgi:hypothetical protein
VLNPVWKNLRGLKIPSKVKKFHWCALHDVIPLKSILANRHIGTSGQCPICMQGPEDIKNLLFQCDTASKIWMSLELSEAINDAMISDRAGSTIREHLLRSDGSMPRFNSIGVREVIRTTRWYLWWIR